MAPYTYPDVYYMPPDPPDLEDTGGFYCAHPGCHAWLAGDNDTIVCRDCLPLYPKEQRCPQCDARGCNPTSGLCADCTEEKSRI